VRGLTYCKLLTLLEQLDVDVLCIQETWIAEGAQLSDLPGYRVVEQRRPTGSRGGIATYIRLAFQIEASVGNEYGMLTKIVLPTS
jgi:exonuclease III